MTCEQYAEGQPERPLAELTSLIGRAVRLVWSAARREVIADVALTTLAAVMTTGLVLLVRSIASTALENPEDVRSAAVPALLCVALLTGSAVAALWQGECRRLTAELVTRRAQRSIADAAVAVELVDFERPDFHDRLTRAMANVSTRPVQVVHSLTTLASALLTSAGIAVALVAIDPLLVLGLVAASVPTWLVNRSLSRISYAFDIGETSNDRQRAYLMLLLTFKRPAKEIRAFGLGHHLGEAHDALWAERVDRLRTVARRRVVLGSLGRVANGLLLLAVVGLLGWLVSSGRIEPADAAVAVGALVLLGQRLTGGLGASARLYECSLFLSDVEAFVEEAQATAALQREAPGLDEPLRELVLRDVSFTYPAAEAQALSGISLEVRRGEVVALVGANGSGKTTLAKILSQLYVPSTGTITWNGVQADATTRTALRHHIAAIFQDFEQYLFTAAENISFGRVERRGDRDAIHLAADRAGAGFVQSLPRGWDSRLGPEFYGGMDLSIGQWQRIAVARAFFRDGSLVVLDEPSSALDAAAEAELFDRLHDLCRDRAAVVVSHRLSTVSRADRIYVLDGGRIVEAGTHAELLRLDGKYAKLFRLQASRYLDDLAERSSGEEVARIDEIEEGADVTSRC